MIVKISIIVLCIINIVLTWRTEKLRRRVDELEEKEKTDSDGESVME